MVTILIIDDKEDNLFSISALLKSFIPHCSVITARSGTEGVKKARVELPDTILLDIIMPGMDGYEVCRKLKSDEKTKHIPVILITAIKTDSESRVKGLDLGADAFLSKPVEGAELSAQVSAMLRIKYNEDALRKQEALLRESHMNLEKKISERTSDLMKANQELALEIEERKRAEAELEKHQNHLETLVKEQTNELEEKVAELERMNDLFVGREFRIKELKDRINELEGKESSKTEGPE